MAPDVISNKIQRNGGLLTSLPKGQEARVIKQQNAFHPHSRSLLPAHSRDHITVSDGDGIYTQKCMKAKFPSWGYEVGFISLCGCATLPNDSLYSLLFPQIPLFLSLLKLLFKYLPKYPTAKTSVSQTAIRGRSQRSNLTWPLPKITFTSDCIDLQMAWGGGYPF